MASGYEHIRYRNRIRPKSALQEVIKTTTADVTNAIKALVIGQALLQLAALFIRQNRAFPQKLMSAEVPY